MTKEQKIILFSRFGIRDDEPIDEHAIHHIHRRLTAEMWKDYINELKNMMLNQIERHERMVSKLTMEEATSYLLLMASSETKAIAILKALGIHSF